MAQEPLAAANVSMLRRVTSRKPRREGPPTRRAKVAGPFHFSRAGWFPLLNMRASKQAIVPCIMLPRAHNLDRQRVER
jgi:hypothetical protein